LNVPLSACSLPDKILNKVVITSEFSLNIAILSFLLTENVKFSNTPFLVKPFTSRMSLPTSLNCLNPMNGYFLVDGST
jgi:hypothetical protein